MNFEASKNDPQNLVLDNDFGGVVSAGGSIG